MLDPNFRWFSNINYTSHYHDKQFLHSMASSGFGREDNEPASLTTHKIMTWAEFAFRVADGSIPASMRIADVPKFLRAGREVAFNGAFAPYAALPVGVLFAGTDQFDAHHVRQLALGALLHTVQDSFSASHVEREHDSLPTVLGRGRVLRFLNYRHQQPAEHGKADEGPRDKARAGPGDFHPVSLGARLLACAAAAQPNNSTWTQAQEVFVELLRRARPDLNPPSSAGRFGGAP